MSNENQFEYVNTYYQLNLKKHTPVIDKDGKRGQVVKAKGQYIYIQWDGEDKPKGPYHPTSELKYPDLLGKGGVE